MHYPASYVACAWVLCLVCFAALINPVHFGAYTVLHKRKHDNININKLFY